jgi:glycosyltransferase involved in cell wall biosynthesis
LTQPVATTETPEHLAGARVLLIDPSEKGALPLYTGMVAEGLVAIGLKPVLLASRHLLPPDLAITWPIYRWLPAQRWPPPPGARISPAWRQAINWLGCASVIVAAAIALRPRIIHIQHPIHPRLDPVLLRVLTRLAPVVWTAHDVVPHDPSSNAMERARRLYSLPQVVLVHSISAAREVGRIAGVSAVVIQHPARRLDVVPDRLGARQRLGLDPQRRLAVLVGFIRAYKGYDLIADTWSLLGDDAPDLLVLGELVDESEREVVSRLQAHPRAHVRLGYASDADIIGAMAAADIILLPHKRGSDSGSLHMARAVGTPVLSSDMDHLASVVAATAAGRVLPRDPEKWAEALVGDLPPPPPKPPLPAATGEEHRNAYRKALRRWRSRSPAPSDRQGTTL